MKGMVRKKVLVGDRTRGWVKTERGVIDRESEGVMEELKELKGGDEIKRCLEEVMVMWRREDVKAGEEREDRKRIEGSKGEESKEEIVRKMETKKTRRKEVKGQEDRWRTDKDPGNEGGARSKRKKTMEEEKGGKG